MTDVKITIESDVKIMLAHLHFPDEMAHSVGLKAPGETKIAVTKDGLYHVSLSATAQEAGKVIKTTFETYSNSLTRLRRIKNDGTIGSLVPFFLEGSNVS